MHQNENSEKTAREEFIALVKERALTLWLWFKPNPDDSTKMQVLKTILKLPALLLVILLSPIALLILTFIFVILL